MYERDQPGTTGGLLDTKQLLLLASSSLYAIMRHCGMQQLEKAQTFQGSC